MEPYCNLHIIPPSKHGDDVGPSDVGGPCDDVPPPSPAMANQQRLQMIYVIMDNLMGLLNLDGRFKLWHRRQHKACG